MTISFFSVFSGTPNPASDLFRRYLLGLTDSAVAVIDGQTERYILTTFDDSATFTGSSTRVSAGRETVTEKDLQAVEAFDLSAEDLAALESLRTKEVPEHNKRWHGFRIKLRSGRRDRVALELEPEIDTELVTRFLERVWPLLRGECTAKPDSSDVSREAIAWSVLDRLDVAVFILDQASLMHRLNAAARQMLKDAEYLRRGRGGLFATDDESSRILREAVKRVSSSDECDATAEVVFLSSQGDDQTLPVTLSRYIHDGEATRFVTATVPVAPSRSRIETYARQLGLSPTEARVAALVQTGCTNKEAAELAGMKEQTFSTYAKRIFSKLNVRNRSDMAQLLTWQSNGGT